MVKAHIALHHARNVTSGMWPTKNNDLVAWFQKGATVVNGALCCFTECHCGLLREQESRDHRLNSSDIPKTCSSLSQNAAAFQACVPRI